ncbi:hypothetical protein V5O48_001426 [Marasmius crinis-equi]|uniref:Uncharacterized protein n=1 Tax=Marasmius crinis-equi TaxID=585013 RepID=A0ABR3FYJ6_9AGAR
MVCRVASQSLHRSRSHVHLQSRYLGPTSFKRNATSTTPHSTSSDPAEVEALRCLEEGTQKLEEGDVQAAKTLYKRSAEIKRNASSLFNLGVTHYHLSASYSNFPDIDLPAKSDSTEEFDDAIEAWKESISLQPQSPDAHTTGRLEEALEQYKRSRDFGVERAAMHVRNVSAKILGKRMKETQDSENSGS